MVPTDVLAVELLQSHLRARAEEVLDETAALARDEFDANDVAIHAEHSTPMRSIKQTEDCLTSSSVVVVSRLPTKRVVLDGSSCML